MISNLANHTLLHINQQRRGLGRGGGVTEGGSGQAQHHQCRARSGELQLGGGDHCCRHSEAAPTTQVSTSCKAQLKLQSKLGRSLMKLLIDYLIEILIKAYQAVCAPSALVRAAAGAVITL